MEILTSITTENEDEESLQHRNSKGVDTELLKGPVLPTSMPQQQPSTLRQRKRMSYTVDGAIPIDESDEPKSVTEKTKVRAIGVWNSLFVPIIRIFMPKYMTSSDMEGATSLPRYAESVRQWWLYYRSPIKKALLVAILLASLFAAQYYGSPYLAKFKPHTIFRDRHGRSIDNVMTDIRFRSEANDMNSLFWKDAKTEIPIDVTEKELDSGFAESTVIGEGEMNVSLSIMEIAMRNACSIEECRCIAAYHFGVLKNVALVNTDSDQAFMVNPKIIDSSEEKVKVNFFNPDEKHENLHKEERWTEVPLRINVQYDTTDRVLKQGKRVLLGRQSACVFRITQVIRSRALGREIN